MYCKKEEKLVTTLDITLPHDHFPDKDEFFRLELLSSFGQTTTLLIYQVDVSCNADGSPAGPTWAYEFDCRRNILRKVDFYRGDFRKPGYNWGEAIFWPTLKNIIKEAHQKAYWSAEKIHDYLQVKIPSLDDKSQKDQYVLLLRPLERIVQNSASE